MEILLKHLINQKYLLTLGNKGRRCFCKKVIFTTREFLHIKMETTIRKPDLKDICELGIPRDFKNSMNLFNGLLKQGKLKYIPRKNPVTVDEVAKLWVPSAERNITYVGYFDTKLVASGTLLIDADSNQYSKESGRGREYALTFHPVYLDIARDVTKAVMEEAKQRNEPFVLHISVNDADQNMLMTFLGHDPTKKIDFYERYAKAGLNPSVYEYII